MKMAHLNRKRERKEEISGRPNLEEGYENLSLTCYCYVRKGRLFHLVNLKTQFLRSIIILSSDAQLKTLTELTMNIPQ